MPPAVAQPTVRKWGEGEEWEDPIPQVKKERMSMELHVYSALPSAGIGRGRGKKTDRHKSVKTS